MHPLLAAFLADLTAAGMPVLARDYRRLRLAFAAEHTWDHTSLRETLTVLLARDPNQQKRCGELFDNYFPRFQEEPEALHALVLNFNSGKLEVEAQATTRSWLILLHPVLFLLSLWAIWPKEPPIPPEELGIQQFHVEIEAIDEYNGLRMGDGRVKHTNIVNRSDQPVTLDLVILPIDLGFRVVDGSTSLSLAPHETLKLEIIFDGPPNFLGYAEAQLIALPPEPDHALIMDLCAKVDPRPQPRLSEVNFPVLESSSTGEATSIKIVVSDLPFKRIWKYFFVVSLVLTLILLPFLAYLRRWQRLPHDAPAEYEANHPDRYFSVGSVAGPPPSFLSSAELDAIAVVVGNYLTQELSSKLDTLSSIKASMARGIAELRFQRARRPRTLLVLEDQGCEAVFRLTVAEELVTGLQKRGCSAIYGRCSPGQAKIWDRRGQTLELEVLEAEPQALTVLVVGDGACFKNGSLFRVSSWARLAWLDVREPRLRGPSAVNPRLPVFSANGVGILACMNAFHHEAWSGAIHQADNPGLPCASVGIAGSLAVESLLGEALIWAADCALLQPCSLGLAHSLRQKHHPHLEAWLIQRILRLAGTSLGPEGLHYSSETRAILHEFWRNRRDEISQKAVLQTILSGLELAKPKANQSLAYRSWEVLREFLGLLMEPNTDHRRLAELAGSPLGSALRAQLEYVQIIQGNEPMVAGKIPIRVDNRDARQRLACISDGLGLAHTDRYPLKRWHRWAQTLLTVLFFGALGFTIHRWHWEKQQPRWQVKGLNAGDRLDVLDSKDVLQAQSSKDGHSVMPLTGSLVAKWRKSGRLLTAFCYVEPDKYIAFEMVREGKGRVNLVRVVAGSFIMGSRLNDPDRRTDEMPHRVTLSQDYYLGATEVTQAFWRDVMGSLPGEQIEQGDLFPVNHLSWYDAMAFCDKLTARERAAGRLPLGWKYALPTEAQWEYAARAGTDTIYPFGDDATTLGEYAWYSGNKVRPVGGKVPNPWGLYDTLGNLQEWCADWYAVYPKEFSLDPKGPIKGSQRVLRGGSLFTVYKSCRASFRSSDLPTGRDMSNGLRVALVQDKSLLEEQGKNVAVVWLEPGEFLMRSWEGEKGQRTDETHQQVKLTEAFAMGRYVISEDYFRQIMGTNSLFKMDEYPQFRVSWEEAKKFCAALTEHEKSQLPVGYHYDLPTETQWEYAARAGTQSPLFVSLATWERSESSLVRNAEGRHMPSEKYLDFGLHRFFDLYGVWCGSQFGRGISRGNIPYEYMNVRSYKMSESEGAGIRVVLVK